MNAYVIGHFHLSALRGGRHLHLDVDSPSLVPFTSKFYDRILWFEDLRIYIESGIEISEQTLHTDGSKTGGAGKAYVIKGIDLVKTKDGKIALVSGYLSEKASVFIGSTIDVEYFNASFCGEIEGGQEHTENDAAFAELNNGYETAVIYSKRATLNTHLNDEGKSVVTTEYQMLIAIMRNDTIIRQGSHEANFAYFYTHNLAGEFVAAWIDHDGDVLTEHIESRLEKSHAYKVNVPNDKDADGNKKFVEFMLTSNRWNNL